MSLKTYLDAADAIKGAEEKNGSIKALCLRQSVTNKRATHALAAETWKYRDIIHQVIDKANLTGERNRNDRFLFDVLAFEVLFGRGLRAGGATVRPVRSKKSELKEALAKLMQEKGAKTKEELLPSHLQKQSPLPRYIRVNTLKANVEQVIEELRRRYPQIEGGPQRDKHLSDLLIFPPGTDMHADPLVKNGVIRLQDKASCFPAHVLSPPSDWDVVDCCAAPGNKTTHVAARLSASKPSSGTGRKGSVFAFDADPARAVLLRRTVEQLGASSVRVACRDFLKVNPNDERYANVKGVLCDPSCSGSGMPDRDGESKKTVDGARLKALAEFQTKVILHGLSFPNVERLVYSTCSIHEDENEMVVATVLEHVGDRFQLEKALPSWPRRGLAKYPHGDLCVRAGEEDLTGGFFVACFVRKGTSAPRNTSSSTTRIEKQAATTTVAEKRKKSEPKTNEVVKNVENDDIVAAANDDESQRQAKRSRRGASGGPLFFDWKLQLWMQWHAAAVAPRAFKHR